MSEKNKKFVKRIIKLSKGDDFNECMSEWEITHVLKNFSSWNTSYYVNNINKCICSHYIENQFFINNIYTRERQIVGCCCILRFGEKKQIKEMKKRKKIDYIIPNQEAKGFHYCKYCYKKLSKKQEDNNNLFHKLCLKKYFSEQKTEDNYIIMFGKHKGKRIVEVPEDYLKFVNIGTFEKGSPLYKLQKFLKSNK
jgi:hypothetical protein